MRCAVIEFSLASVSNERSDTEMNYIAEEQQFAQAPCDDYDDETFSFSLRSTYGRMASDWDQSEAIYCESIRLKTNVDSGSFTKRRI